MLDSLVAAFSPCAVSLQVSNFAIFLEAQQGETFVSTTQSQQKQVVVFGCAGGALEAHIAAAH